MLGAFAGHTVGGAGHSFACATTIEHTATDEAFALALASLLRAAGKPLARAALAAFAGVGHEDAFRVATGSASVAS